MKLEITDQQGVHTAKEVPALESFVVHKGSLEQVVEIIVQFRKDGVYFNCLLYPSGAVVNVSEITLVKNENKFITQFNTFKAGE